MASIKFFAAICCAFLIIQTQAHGQSGTEVKDNAFEIAKIAVKAIEKIIDGVLSLITDELERIDKIIDSFRENATPVFTAVAKELGSRIEKLMAKIAADGDDDLKVLMACSENGTKYITAVLVNGSETVAKCRSPNLLKIIAAVETVISDLQTVRTDVKAAADKIDDCDGDNSTSTVIVCAVDVVENVLTVLKDIPNAIGSDAKNAIEVTVTSLGNYAKCAIEAYEDLFEKFLVMLTQIASCVRE